MLQTIRLTELPVPPVGQSAEFTLGDYRVVWQNLREGLSRHVERISILHGENRIAILPTRGMGIEDVTIDGIRFGWDSPVAGPVHPSAVNLHDASGLGWLDGFTELLVRCGLGNNGGPQFDDRDRLQWPLHGRIANAPANDVEFHLREDGSLAVAATVTETRFHFWKWRMDTVTTCSPGLKEIAIADTVTNVGGTTDAFQMLYHFNLGPPLAGPGAMIHLPARRVVPRNEHSATDAQWDRLAGPVPGEAERVWFVDPAFDTDGRSLAVLVAADQRMAAAIDFGRDDGMKHFTLWKNEVALEDGYVVGLEPGTNWPNPRDFEFARGRCLELLPGQSHTIHIGLYFTTDSGKTGEWVARTRSIFPETGTAVTVEVDPQWCA